MTASSKISIKFNCEICGKEKTRFKRSDSKFRFCSTSCAGKNAYEISRKVDKSGEKNGFWKGGRWKNARGYVLVHVPNHPYPNHQKGPYVFEHRLVIERQIGRYLKPEEQVHHLNGNKEDNRLENLVLCLNQSDHIKKYHAQKMGNIGRKIWLDSKPTKNCLVCKKTMDIKSPYTKFCSPCKKRYGWKIYNRLEEVLACHV